MGDKEVGKKRRGRKAKRERRREEGREGILLSSSASFILIFVSMVFVLTQRILDYVTDKWTRFNISVTFLTGS